MLMNEIKTTTSRSLGVGDTQAHPDSDAFTVVIGAAAAAAAYYRMPQKSPNPK